MIGDISLVDGSTLVVSLLLVVMLVVAVVHTAGARLDLTEQQAGHRVVGLVIVRQRVGGGTGVDAERVEAAGPDTVVGGDAAGGRSGRR